MYIRSWGLQGTWVKYNQNHSYLYPFLKNSPTSQTRRRICTHNCSNDADSRKDGPFVICSHCSPFTGSSPFPPQKKQFWGMNRRFQAKLAKSKNVHIIKTTVSIPTKFCPVIKTTKCSSWVVPTYASQIRDGGQPPSRKIEKSPYRSRGLSDFDEIWHNDAVLSSWPFRPLKFEISKIQDGGSQPPSLKIENWHISAKVWAISTKNWQWRSSFFLTVATGVCFAGKRVGYYSVLGYESRYNDNITIHSLRLCLWTSVYLCMTVRFYDSFSAKIFFKQLEGY